MINPPIMTAKGVLVVEDSPYRKQIDRVGGAMGYVRGTNWVMDQVSDPTRLVAVSQLSQLPEMLRKGRIDGFFINEVSWQDLAPRYPTLRAIEVSDLSAHIWLRHEYADLGERISNIVKQLDLKALSQ
jgi:ABC-type amino acid transport substrate-binding protein